MLIVLGYKTGVYVPHAFIGKLFTIKTFEDNLKLQKTGRACLRSIIETKSEHHYKGFWYLIFSLLMRDKIEKAATEVKNIQFASSGSETKLNSAFWERTNNGNFLCKSEEFGKAVSSILTNPQKNNLECQGLSHIMALRALQLALGDTRFNKLLKTGLGKAKLQIPLNATLLQGEDLALKGEEPFSKSGDGVFRPGDIVAFGNNRSEAVGTQWRVENAVCIGWKFDIKGLPLFDEPLFAGGGVDTFKTEGEMKEFIYQQTPIREAPFPSKEVLRRHFAEKAVTGSNCSCPKQYGLEDLNLNPYVTRIKILGGRKDIV
jgi:hypothetical protein